ncbi:MAG: histidine phosphatase family protein, partial [Nocardioidaceae bacterium]|nr:histidine phosphatase family protein [Nocardioidaceae bacterium]
RGSAADGASAALAASNPMLGWNSELGETTTLVFLRHGVTRHTAARKFSGPGGDDPGLIEEGVAQAERAASALARDGGVGAVLTSPMRRTRETARAVEAALGLSATVEEDFRECAFGAWDGLTLAEVQESWPDELGRWLASMDVAPPGGGESIVEVQRRVESALVRSLSAYAGQTVVVVSHVNPIKLAVRYCLDVPLHSVNRMLLAPASLTTLSFYASGASALRQFSAVP